MINGMPFEKRVNDLSVGYWCLRLQNAWDNPDYYYPEDNMNYWYTKRQTSIIDNQLEQIVPDIYVNEVLRIREREKDSCIFTICVRELLNSKLNIF